MKRIVTISIVMAGILGLSSGLMAEQGDLRVKVPFSFAVGDKVLPAGGYDIQRQGALLYFRSRDGVGQAIAIPMPGVISSDGKSRLLFDQREGQFFLRTIATPWASSSVVLAKSRLERRSEELPSKGNATGLGR